MRFGNLLLVLLLHTLLYGSLLHALESNQTNSSITLLPQSKIISAHDIFDINSTTSRANFKSTNKKSLLFAKSRENIWVELNFNTRGFEEPLLYLDSPLFSKLKIYDSNGLLLRDLSYSKRQQVTLLPYFRLQKNSTIKLYLQLQSRFMPVVTGVNLTTKAKFLQHDSETKFYNTLTLGIVAVLLLFLLLYLYYSKKIELLYLIVFILSVLYFQLTYSGFTQILTNHYYALLDLSISSVKINLIAISLFLYSVSLLNIGKKSRLYFTIKLFAFISFVEIFIVGFINMNPYYAIIPLLA
ncbi:MAG TPA: hypothetical protein ENL00_01885, partial [Nitratifractor sp.]|nr:hypothetical protein [Nitratifractor sp.]